MYTPKFNQVSDRALLIEAMRAYSFAVLFGPQEWLERQWLAAGNPSAAGGERRGRTRTAGRPFRLCQSALEIACRAGDAGCLQRAAQLCLAHSLRRSRCRYQPGITSPCTPMERSRWWRTTGQGSLARRSDRAHEPAYAEKWRAMPDGFRRSMLAGIVGFRIPIARIEGKFKLSQNRPEEDRRNVQAAHAARRCRSKSAGRVDGAALGMRPLAASTGCCMRTLRRAVVYCIVPRKGGIRLPTSRRFIDPCAKFSPLFILIFTGVASCAPPPDSPALEGKVA